MSELHHSVGKCSFYLTINCTLQAPFFWQHIKRHSFTILILASVSMTAEIAKTSLGDQILQLYSMSSLTRHKQYCQQGWTNKIPSAFVGLWNIHVHNGNTEYIKYQLSSHSYMYLKSPIHRLLNILHSIYCYFWEKKKCMNILVLNWSPCQNILMIIIKFR